jgi:hypothetical protein
MEFAHLLRMFGAAKGQDAWVAVTSGTAEMPRAAVLHGNLGEVDVPPDAQPGEQGPAFVPVDIAREPELHGTVGVTLDPAEFEGAEGSLPGDLIVRLRDFNVRVATL